MNMNLTLQINCPYVCAKIVSKEMLPCDHIGYSAIATNTS